MRNDAEDLEVLEVDTLPQAPYGRHFDRWQAEFAANKTALAFDDWLPVNLGSRRQPDAPAARVGLRQDGIVFVLEHGATYQANHLKAGLRTFQCIIDENYPLIAFIEEGTGTRYPWLNLNQLFTRDELKSLRRIL